MFDLLIKNGKVIDGTGRPSYPADLAISGDKIVDIATSIEAEAAETIDAAGRVVSPGFIDMHSHSDFSLLVHPKAESKIRQGVTTEVVGNCGGSPAPVPDERLDAFRQYASGLGSFYNNVLTPADWNWKTLTGFYEALNDNGLALNVAPLVGHSTLRCHVMGYENRPPSQDELEAMKKLLKTEMEGGLFGLSTGLIYHPGAFARREELAELAKVVQSYDGFYSSHIRSEGKFLFEAIDEVIWITKASGVSTEISHLKCETPLQWGKASRLLERIQLARDKGFNINFDQYPYPAFHCGLLEIFPTADKDKGPEHLIGLLRNETSRQKVMNGMINPLEDWDNPMDGLTWDRVRLVGFARPENRSFESGTIEDIANSLGLDPLEAIFKLFVEENGGLGMIVFSMCEDDIEDIMKHPLGMIGSDGSSVAPYGPTSYRNVHPRNYGTFPRVLGKYVRERKVIPLEEAIRKMTGLAAEKLRLTDRGRLQKGYRADITVFDDQAIDDRSTFENPHQFSSGIDHVIVNGKVVVSNGEHTDRLPGRVLTLG